MIRSHLLISEIQPRLREIEFVSAVECQNELRDALGFCSKDALSVNDILEYSFGGDYEALVQSQA